MTVDRFPTTREDQLRASRDCNHTPKDGTINADDSYDNKTMYVADCRDCVALIKTDYTEEQPENTDWVGFRD